LDILVVGCQEALELGGCGDRLHQKYLETTSKLKLKLKVECDNGARKGMGDISSECVGLARG
jgi:hypothetical protein